MIRKPDIVALMIPLMMVIMSSSMFSVALPAMRGAFHIEADLAAWLVTAQLLPFIIFMPVYGRLADVLGKRRLLLLSTVVFFAGATIVILTKDLVMLFAGRVIQGVGASGANPLGLAIISDRFPNEKRGKALGTWNSVGPVSNIVGLLLAGLLVDHFGWRAVYLPTILLALAAAGAVLTRIPKDNQQKIDFTFFRTFDWLGVALLALSITLLAFFVSSRVISGRNSLQDWRLLVFTLLCFTSFVLREKRAKKPFVDLTIFSTANFSRAAFCVGMRMFLMNGINLLVPLYLADVFSLGSSLTGILLMVHAVSLFITMRVGGHLAGRRSSRLVVVSGLIVQIGSMILFALLPAGSSPAFVALGLFCHGAGAGLSLAVLHLTALDGISSGQEGIAAGLYSMMRFSGSMVGSALCGVILHKALGHYAVPSAAYQTVYWIIAVVAITGVIAALKLKTTVR